MSFTGKGTPTTAAAATRLSFAIAAKKNTAITGTITASIAAAMGMKTTDAVTVVVAVTAMGTTKQILQNIRASAQEAFYLEAIANL